MNNYTIFNNESIAAWLAGLYEGEGCVQAPATKTGTVNLRLVIKMTDFDIIERLPVITGSGTLNVRERSPHKPIMAWTVGVDRDVIAIADRILPWLGERRSRDLKAAIQSYRDNRPVVRTVEERFWSHVVSEGDHWLWTGHIDRFGFGTYLAGRGGKRTQAHRFAYERTNGAVRNLRLKNECGIKHCVLPDHWSVKGVWASTEGTERKGAVRRGSESPQSKLTEADVAIIKRELAQGTPNKTLAERFNVNSATISYIRSGKTWRHVMAEAVDES